VPEPLTIGPTRLWIHSRHGEVRVAVEAPEGPPRAVRKEADLVTEGSLLPEVTSEEDRRAQLESLTWRRYVCPSPPDTFRLAPRMPDRPLILAGETLFDVRPGARVRFYVAVPAWISVRIPGADPEVLLEHPTSVLSATWFGDFFEGEHCYWTPTRSRTDPARLPRADHLVTCPIEVTNRSEDPLVVDKLALRVQHVSIFRDGDRLWADETRIAYLGGGEFSKIHWSGKPPREAQGATRLAEPMVKARKGLTAWTFDRIGSLSGWGR
jgi:hypothetical protein